MSGADFAVLPKRQFQIAAIYLADAFYIQELCLRHVNAISDVSYGVIHG